MSKQLIIGVCYYWFVGVGLQNCTGSPFNSAGTPGTGGNNGGTSRQRLLELSHGLGALRHYNDLANHVLSLNQQGAVVTKLLGKCIHKSKSLPRLDNREQNDSRLLDDDDVVVRAFLRAASLSPSNPARSWDDNK